MDRDIENNSPLKEVGEFKLNELTLKVLSDSWPDGRKHLYFVDSPAEIRTKEQRRGREVTRMGYRVFGDEAVLFGFVVSSKYADKDLGKEIIDYFIQFVEKKGLKFMGTGQINKPMIAQTLMRAGFEPMSKDVLVEILPRSNDDKSRVPNVQIISNENVEELVTESQGGKFYRIVPREEVLRKYPLTTPDSIVAIQTRYVMKPEVQ